MGNQVYINLPYPIFIGIIGIFIVMSIYSLYGCFKYYDNWKQEQYRNLHFDIYAMYKFDNLFRAFIKKLDEEFKDNYERCVVFGIPFRYKEYGIDSLKLRTEKRYSIKIEQELKSIMKDNTRIKNLESCRTKLHIDIYNHFKNKIAPRRQEELDSLIYAPIIKEVFQIQNITTTSQTLKLDYFVEKFAQKLNIPKADAWNIIYRIANYRPDMEKGSPNDSLIITNKSENYIMLGPHWDDNCSNKYPIWTSLWDAYKYSITDDFIRFKPYKYL